MRKIGILFGVVLLVNPVYLFTYSPAHTHPLTMNDQYGGTLHLGYTTDVETLDPHRISIYYEDFDSSIAAVNQIFEGLVCYKSGTAEIEPLLAESWDISDDGLVYTFHLRKNVYWHDGNDTFSEGKSRQVTADDFVYSWDRATAPETLSPMKDFFSDTAKIKSWRSAGSLTFEVTLKQPNPSFLYMLPFPCFSVVPRELEEYGLDLFSAHAVGTGPFEFKSQVDNLILKYNEDYWGGEPYVTEIYYRVIKPENMQQEFENGSIDWCLIPDEYGDRFPSTITAPRLEILYIGMNCQKNPFTDRRVRQAINYALDPGAALFEIYKGRAVQAESIIPPGFICYKKREDLYPLSVEKAVELLEEAGYTGEPRLTIELKSSESYIQQQFNELYKEQLNKIGVELIVTYLDLGSLLQAVDTGDTQMFTMGWYADWPYPDQFLLLFHSRNWGFGGNGSFYLNKTVDEVLEEAGKEPDIAKACSLFEKAEDMILEDSPWILQWRRVDGYAVQEWINSFNPGGMGDKYEKLGKIWISSHHRQTTRIPQKTESGRGVIEYLPYIAVIGAVVIMVVILVIRKKREKKSRK